MIDKINYSFYNFRMRITVGVTCYNCENQITRALNEIDSILSSVPEIHEVLVLDNRSTDNTLKVAGDSLKSLKHSKKFKVFQNVKNVGLGGSHKIAFDLAHRSQSSHLLIFHGDHQASALDIQALVHKALQNNSSTCLGARFLDLSLLNGYSLIRTAGNIFLNILYSIFCRKKIYDLGSGLNLFKVSDFDLNAMQYFDDGFTFNMDLLLHMIEQKVFFTYHPIRWSTSDQISNARAVAVGFKTLTKLFSWLLGLKKNISQKYSTVMIFEGKSVNE
jgi:dolichol-phosphate mannosyltransferase